MLEDRDRSAEDTAVTGAAPAGDEEAFGALAEPLRRELRVHCYRMLGSYDDAEDMVQETFLRAWRHRDTYEGRSSFRAWLYKIATNACLDLIDRTKRRVQPYRVPPLVDPGAPAQPPADVSWLQPVPDRLLEPAADSAQGPASAAVARETIELAFLVAIQHLPARQRAVLITRDVLGWPATETAALLGTSVASVKSALQRARATLKRHLPQRREDWTATARPSADERALVRRYVEAHQRADLGALAGMLADDVRMTMPPHPAWLIGRQALLTFSGQVFKPGSPWYHGRWRGVVTGANLQPAVAHYVEHPTADETKNLDGRFRAQVLDVLRIDDGRITSITSFEPRCFAAFGLPLILP
ncbi:sigma-70 family RNA polymerase sigma factor [Streptosporangium roseum]|uniref:RNA polymerase, sigma-24 subunit, ECF subfamily n=1 Tax=Streptosporangium roseum (strain ATCC 12428 / DSM 43021 / JCM 3005 / KCTC 9067 / NCIMB 10171 / NRRL 2505 / NI 9100) TaxID=479432 RepID=D2BDQ3_STRRD|nr:sigma-70 family RNA polymerase sigma factor [Streptosporangium roseum]ACZ88145.1 RNA polymerase, sigma-24 subunit, ECF subfamily [Streptosporangium roseum DSM 43021]